MKQTITILLLTFSLSASAQKDTIKVNDSIPLISIRDLHLFDIAGIDSVLNANYTIAEINKRNAVAQAIVLQINEQMRQIIIAALNKQKKVKK